MCVKLIAFSREICTSRGSTGELECVAALDRFEDPPVGRDLSPGPQKFLKAASHKSVGGRSPGDREATSATARDTGGRTHENHGPTGPAVVLGPTCVHSSVLGSHENHHRWVSVGAYVESQRRLACLFLPPTQPTEAMGADRRAASLATECHRRSPLRAPTVQGNGHTPSSDSRRSPQFP